MKLADLQVSIFNARQSHSEEDVIDLGSSINKYGMVSKIILRKRGDYYEVIAGGRRYMVLKQLHGEDYELPESDYILMDDLTDQEALVISIQENQQRTPLSPFDMAQIIRKLRKDFEVSEEEILKILNINNYRYKRLLNLIKDWDEIKAPEIKEELKKPEGVSSFTDAHWERMRKVENPDVVKDVFDWIMDKQCPPADLPLVIKGIEHNHKKEKEAVEGGSESSDAMPKAKSFENKEEVAPVLEGPIEYEHKGELTLIGKGKKRILSVSDDRETVEVPVSHYIEFLKYPEQFKCYVSFKLTVKPIE